MYPNGLVESRTKPLPGVDPDMDLNITWPVLLSLGGLHGGGLIPRATWGTPPSESDVI